MAAYVRDLSDLALVLPGDDLHRVSAPHVHGRADDPLVLVQRVVLPLLPRPLVQRFLI